MGSTNRRWNWRVLAAVTVPAVLVATGCSSRGSDANTDESEVRASACAEGVFPPMPSETGYSSACGARVRAIIEKPTSLRMSPLQVPVSSRCNYPVATAEAVAAYRAYWDRVVGWKSFAGARDPETMKLEVKISYHDDLGSTVVVSDGSDESAMGFVFDYGRKLLAYYQYNQSPSAAFFCGDGSAANPDRACLASVGSALQNGIVGNTGSTKVDCLK